MRKKIYKIQRIYDYFRPFTAHNDDNCIFSPNLDFLHFPKNNSAFINFK